MVMPTCDPETCSPSATTATPFRHNFQLTNTVFEDEIKQQPQDYMAASI